MKILGLGVPELLIILVVILLIFGPKNLPKLGSALGKTVKNIREGLGSGKKVAEEDSEPVEEEKGVKGALAEADDEDEASAEPAPKKRVVRVKASQA